MESDQLQQLEQLLGHRFSNPELAVEALSHSSQASDRLTSNERMEFLGDSVLALVICNTLFTKFPEYLEGDLTKIKSRLVSRKTCSLIANELGLSSFVKVGKGMSKSVAINGSIAAGVFESIIAAIYIDGGFESAAKFIVRVFGPLIDDADAKEHQENFKSLLQQYSQQHFGVTPLYELLDEKGPDHNKCFETGVVIGHRRYISAWGVTKKDAEQKAAYNALIDLGLIEEEETA
jgi:ribonuclease-3